MSCHLDKLLMNMVARGASDMHLSRNLSPAFRVDGALREADELPRLTPEVLDQLACDVLDQGQQQSLKQLRSLDMGYTHSQGHRFRFNFYYERGGLALAVRYLDGSFHELQTLGLPSALERLVEFRDGLVLVTGATGSGKSTTLASLINQINLTRACHILTIEDPIEFLHTNRQALVHQREVGRDVPGFAEAIRSALREDPDVILLGEMRDLETIQAAIHAAETGHLVLATLHTNDAVGVIERLIGVFPGNRQVGIRQQLSQCLRAVVTQGLLPCHNRPGRVPVNEVLFVNAAVAHMIRERNTTQIRSVMETGQAQGNQTLEQALALRVRENLISLEQAERYTLRPEQLQQALRVLGANYGRA